MNDVVHERDRHRFSLRIGAQEAVIDYVPLGARVLDVRRTYVPPELRGRGIASRLAAHVLDYARAQGLTVVPTCSFFAWFIESHPEHADLVERR